ncbi:MAG TPA: hypothetical protein VJW20_00495 [Candidatus Angelobacter sp.]|nr:hypothetical protein [Candidatus Angelobacter sp.]
MLSRACKLALAFVLTVGMLLLTGCPTTSIAEINRDPGRFAGKNVSIHGTVSDSFGALGNGIFQIDDGSGRMWIYSQNYGVPGNGNRVTVTGRIEQGFAFGGRSFGVILRETESRH